MSVLMQIKKVDGRREGWLIYHGVGGWVCAEVDQATQDGLCGMPVESEPCDIHHPGATDVEAVA